MKQMITLEDIRSFKNISANTSPERINIHINEAQRFDVIPVFGSQFFIEIESAFTAPNIWSAEKWSNLFNGCTYTYQGRTYRHDGIRGMLVYYAYARFKADSNSHDTAFGSVIKTNDQSTYVSEKTISRQISDAESMAGAIKLDVVDYLDRNMADFPSWRTRTETDFGSTTGGISIRAIGGRKKIASSYPCRTCGRYTNCICK